MNTISRPACGLFYPRAGLFVICSKICKKIRPGRIRTVKKTVLNQPTSCFCRTMIIIAVKLQIVKKNRKKERI